MALRATLAVSCTATLLLCPVLTGATGIIHEPPADQTTWMGQNATFTCVASGLFLEWIIIRNGARCDSCGPTEGFWFSEAKLGDHEDMYMIVLATASNNNTQVVCRATYYGGVEEAAVLIVQGPPSPPTLTLRPVSTTVIELILQEPFSWPEYPVTGYSLKWDGQRHELTLTNDSLPDGRYTMNITRSNSDECAKITVTATASSVIGESQAISVSEGFPLYPGPFTGPVNSSVVRHDCTPMVTITSELPYRCDYQELSVTITATPTSQSLPPITRGPMLYVYSERPSMREQFETEFVSDMEYMVVVLVENVVGSSMSGNYSVSSAFRGLTHIDAMDDLFDIHLDRNCTFVVNCLHSQIDSYDVTIHPVFSATMVPCTSPLSIMLNRIKSSTMMYEYTVQASDGCLEVMIQGTFDEDDCDSIPTTEGGSGDGDDDGGIDLTSVVVSVVTAIVVVLLLITIIAAVVLCIYCGWCGCDCCPRKNACNTGTQNPPMVTVEMKDNVSYGPMRVQSHAATQGTRL